MSSQIHEGKSFYIIMSYDPGIARVTKSKEDHQNSSW